MRTLLLVALTVTVAMAIVDGAGAQVPQRQAAPAAPAAAAPAAPAGNAKNGRTLWVTYGCYQCHGYEAQGGAAPRVGPRPLAFAAFSRYVRQPSNQKPPFTTQMPPYTTKVLSDAELVDMHAFLQSLPVAPPVESIPLLQ